MYFFSVNYAEELVDSGPLNELKFDRNQQTVSGWKTVETKTIWKIQNGIRFIYETINFPYSYENVPSCDCTPVLCNNNNNCVYRTTPDYNTRPIRYFISQTRHRHENGCVFRFYADDRVSDTPSRR